MGILSMIYKETDIDAIKRLINKNTKIQLEEAIISNVTAAGSIKVQIIGSSQTVDVEHVANLTLKQGDHVIMFKSELVNRWIIFGSYVISQIDGNPSSPTNPSTDTQLAPPQNVATVAGIGEFFVRWEAPGARSDLLYEIDVANDTSDTGSVIYRVAGSTLPVTALGVVTRYVRVRSVDVKWNRSSWTDWKSVTTLAINQGSVHSVVTSDYTIVKADGLIPVDTTAGEVPLHLPLATDVGVGWSITIKDVGGNCHVKFAIVHSNSTDFIGYGSNQLLYVAFKGEAVTFTVTKIVSGVGYWSTTSGWAAWGVNQPPNDVKYGGWKIKELGDPTEDQDAATRKWVLDQLGTATTVTTHRCKYSMSATQTVTNTSAHIKFDTLVSDADSAGSVSGSVFKFTAPVTGIYTFAVALTITYTGGARFVDIAVVRASDDHNWGTIWSNQTDPGLDTAINYTKSISLTAADQVYIRYNVEAPVSGTPAGTLQIGSLIDIHWTTSTGGGGGSLTVQEEDGTPLVTSVTTIKVTNGTLTDHGGGVVSVDTTGGGGTITYPKRADMWHDNALVTVGAAFTTDAGAVSQNYGFRTYQSPGANADAFTNSCLIQAGTYTFKVFGEEGDNRGKIDWYLDGAGSPFLSGQDWYNVAGDTPRKVHSGSITIATDGYHKITGVINGKNGSSSGYYITLQKYSLQPSAD
jgi:hypothetical protein